MENILALATAIRRRSRDPEVIELCDLATALAIGHKLTSTPANKITDNKITDCPKCAAAKKANADYQRRFRAKAKSNGTGTTA